MWTQHEFSMVPVWTWTVPEIIWIPSFHNSTLWYLALTISCYTISYQIILCYIILYNTISCYIIRHEIIWKYIMLSHTILYHTIVYCDISYNFISYSSASQQLPLHFLLFSEWRVAVLGKSSSFSSCFARPERKVPTPRWGCKAYLQNANKMLFVRIGSNHRISASFVSLILTKAS